MVFSENGLKEDWAEVRIDREKTANSICQNLVVAGVLLPAEVERYKAVLRDYDALKLVKVLLESWLLRETHEEVQH